jgi:hypothetical protein
MEINKEKVIQYRIKHPNCLYCQYLSKDRYILYHCQAKQKTFLVGNRVKARKCPLYTPQVDDLDFAVKAFKEATEAGVIDFDI